MKTALVTGASKGLGLEWCRQLASDGFTVFLTARRLDQAQLAAKTLSDAGLDVRPKTVDVGQERQIEALAAELAQEIEHLDVLVNNAGINSKDDPDPSVVALSSHLAELDPEEVIRHVRVNSVSPILAVKHLRPLLNRSPRPIVINISSWLGSVGDKKTSRGHYAYTTSKAALNMMNRNLAIELKDEGIISLVVNPGWVRTTMGGNAADLSPEQSVRGLIDNVIARVSLQDSGEFFQWDGSKHPW